MKAPVQSQAIQSDIRSQSDLRSFLHHQYWGRSSNCYQQHSKANSKTATKNAGPSPLKSSNPAVWSSCQHLSQPALTVEWESMRRWSITTSTAHLWRRHSLLLEVKSVNYLVIRTNLSGTSINPREKSTQDLSSLAHMVTAAQLDSGFEGA